MSNKRGRASGDAPPPGADDFGRIRGIGPGIKSRLYAAGILTFVQLADLPAEEVAARVGDFPGKSAELIQDWIGQARALYTEAGGLTGQTEDQLAYLRDAPQWRNALIMQLPNGMDELLTIGWALKMNNIKVSSSELAPRIVHDALQIVGIGGYKNDGKYTVGRNYRDALSAALMISNERIFAKTASMLLVYKDE